MSRGIAVTILVGLVVFLFSPVSRSDANGVPQLVKLSYLDGISNWGPTDGEGVLEFSFAEAYARVDVKNLDPQDGYQYEAWMTGPGGENLFVGELAVDVDGIGAIDVSLSNEIDSIEFDTFVIAGREVVADEEPTPETMEMPETISIAGQFEVLDAESNDGTSNEVRPDVLPYTGEEPGPGFISTYWPTAAAVAASALVVGVIARTRHKKGQAQ